MADLPVITDAVLDQWEIAARADSEDEQPFSLHPLAVLAVIAEVRTSRARDDVAWLRDRADELDKEAARVGRNSPGRPHAAVLRTQAKACALAAGELRDHHAALAAATDKET